ncbi:hypothetical protein EN802_04580 [bacterium M00.F.Ca.ET.159.01.1.1]|nr:hypothetical protein EN802_04580 [bacterium M00.F.Ca.ET.159.01.1.1]TGT81602.1 hypothetical protein EN800_22370 [bacterium M00.F.Ca.ET.157.01.1.1]
MGMLRKVSMLAALVVAAEVQAQSIQTVETCRQVANRDERLACYDALPSTVSTAATEVSPVQLSHSFYNVLARDTYRGINSPGVELHVSFANSSPKRVKGLSVLITIKDAFGDAVLVTEAKMTIDIEPHTQTSYWDA